jgi:hypothetical protein
MPTTQVQPISDMGPGDPAAARLAMINQLLADIDQPPVDDLVTFKLRPLDSVSGAPVYISSGEEYPPIRQDLVPDSARRGKGVREFYLVADEPEGRIVYAEHETGLELVLLIPPTAAAVVQLGQFVAPTLGRWMKRMRKALRKGPKPPRRSRMRVDMIRDDRGVALTTVEVEGNFDEAACVAMLPTLIDAGARAMQAP